MGLRVQLFGEFKVWRDGQLVAESAWKNVRTKELFKRLVIELGRHFKAESLATLFWPETDPTSALSALRTRVSELRSALEPGLANGRKSGYLQKVDEGYRLKPDAQITVDVKQFQSLCEAAGREESQGKLRKAAASYEEAIQLYQGPFLKDDLYLDWTQDYREDFRNSFIKVVLHCAECCARLGQYRKAIEVCNQALAKEKEVRSEEVIKKLMLFHYLSGDEAEAVRMFERYAATLRQEQAECSPETIRLYEQIKAQFVSGVDVYPTKTNSLPLHIPYTLSPGSVPFVGRAEELDLLRTCFEEASTGQGCLMIIGGEAGSGKSRLVEQFLKTMPNHGHLALRGRAEGLGAQIPYRIWSELLRQGLKKAGPEGMRKIPSPYLAEFAKIVPELRSKVQEIPTLPLLSPQQEQRRFFEGIWHVLLGLGEASGVLGTTLLFLEDLH
ncbi:AAA family ATPase [Candidatus Acetothermia bacterium]|nr:AAA family ATPase [Candidatus Acetothermia bacterium]